MNAPTSSSKSNISVGVIIASSIPLALMVTGILVELLDWATYSLRPPTGIEDTTLENALFFLGRFFALPCGLINVIVAPSARSKGHLEKKAAVTATVLGVVGIILGGLVWILYIMISSFVF